MMQKFGIQNRNQERRRCATEGRNANLPNAFYYQTVNKAGLNQSPYGDSLPRGRFFNGSEISVAGRVLGNANFVETMPFSRDSCSDTDSGICADNASDCQQSPKCSSAGSPVPPPKPVHHYPTTCPPTLILQPPPLGTLKIRHQPQPASNGQSTYSKRSKQPMKVRFADEPSAEGQCDSAQTPSSEILEGKPYQNRTFYYYSSEKSNATSPAASCIDEKSVQNISASPPPLPDYESAVRRMRSVQSQRVRSTSLPRKSDQYSQYRKEQMDSMSQSASTDFGCGSNVLTLEESRRTRTLPLHGHAKLPNTKSMDSVSRRYERNHVQNATMKFQTPVAYEASKSCENLQAAMEHEKNEKTTVVSRPRFAHCMSSELRKIATNALMQNAQSNPAQSNRLQPVIQNGAFFKNDQTEKRQEQHQIAVNLFPTTEEELARDHNEGEPMDTKRIVETRLLGLDHQGIQIIELRKRDNGPFGFYIATGTFKKKKGIFISRITVRSLYPLLSVGDQILDIDYQPVRGKSLEHVQHMMINADRVILRTLPAIMK